MLFVIIGWDGPDGQEKRPKVRPDHLVYWEEIDTAGKVVVAGPLTDKTGSLFVVDFDSEEAARKHMDGDPYVTKGVFARLEIHPFRGVLPKRIYGAV